MSKINPKMMKSVFTDDILDALPSNENINRGVQNVLHAQDPEWQRKQKEGIHRVAKTEEWKENLIHGMHTTRANGSWRKNVVSGAAKRERENKFDRKALNAKIIASKEWQKAVKKGCAERWQKEENLTICPHCNKKVDNANYRRWHGDNCKQKK